MDEQFYVRIRGRVQGPYDTAKLQSLVRRGQLSRMHEVSTDRNLWRQAADFPELFVTPTAAPVPTTSSQHDGHGADAPLELENSSTGAGEWYYALNQQQKGPVSFEQLKGLLQAGVISGGSLIWKEGMSEWSPAEVVPGLRSFGGSGSYKRGGGDSDARIVIESETLRTLKETLPWVSFLVICLMTICSLMAVSGVIYVLLGVRERETPITAFGLFLLLYAFVGIWGGILLNGYNSNIRLFLQSRSPQMLETGFKSLKSMWTYISIILIIILVNIGSVAIWAFSMGLSIK